MFTRIGAFTVRRRRSVLTLSLLGLILALGRSMYRSRLRNFDEWLLPGLLALLPMALVAAHAASIAFIECCEAIGMAPRRPIVLVFGMWARRGANGTIK